MKAHHGESALFIAGGTDLMLEWKREVAPAFDFVIDITGLSELRYIREDAGELRVGALTTLAMIENATPSNALLICMSAAASQMATPQLRTTATIGGNICHASPVADMATVLSLFDAVATVRSSKGERTIPISEFFVSNKVTSMTPDELLTQVSMPLPDCPTRASYQRAVRSSVDLVQSSVGACLTADEGGRVTKARIAVGACAPVPLRSREAEELLCGLEVGNPDQDAIELAAAQVESEIRPISDLRAGEEYRRDITHVMVRRAVTECLSQLAVRGN